MAQQPAPPPPAPPPHGPPHPGAPPPPDLNEMLADLHRTLEHARPVNREAEDLIRIARDILEQAETMKRRDRLFPAERYAIAANAVCHVAEHQRRILIGPRPPVRPPRDAVAQHLQHSYFRLQQGDYFVHLSHEKTAQSLPQMARSFYQKAVQAYERADYFGADEYAKSVDDTINALESLAQTAMPIPPPPPPPQRP